MPILLNATARCDKCGKEASAKVALGVTDEVLFDLAELVEGWAVVAGVTRCGNCGGRRRPSPPTKNSGTDSDD
jgi:hypothetical protein